MLILISKTNPTEQLKKVEQSPNPKVSVIIPSYNHAHFIASAINSVINQTYHNYEIIIVDDGSQDNTHQVVGQFGSRIRYIWQVNQGLSEARNMGIRLAQGEFISLLDADDLYEPEFLTTLVGVLSDHPETAAVYCACQMVDVDNQSLPQVAGGVVPSEELYNKLLYGGFFPPLCMLVRKKCYEEVGLFDKSFQGCADLDMWLRISRTHHVIGSDKVLARYRIVPQSMSSNPIYMLNDRLSVLRKHLDDPHNDQERWTSTHRKAYGYSYFAAALDYLSMKDLDNAYNMLQQAWLIAPELLTKYDVFYELGCGNQQRGYRGHWTSLDISFNSQVLFSLLERFFGRSGLPVEISAHKGKVFARASFALGVLSYNSRRYSSARTFLLRSLRYDLSSLWDRQIVLTLIKSLPGINFLRLFNKAKIKQA